MKFSHYSAAKIKRVHSVPQKEAPDMKPQGLWLSVDGDDDWLSWCKRAKYGRLASVQKTLRYRINIDLSRMLMLTTLEQLDAFTEQYARTLSVLDVPSPLALAIWIDWKCVAETYAGIIIAPYQWVRRLEYPWYYPWDCASGCVWDAAAVRSIRPLRATSLAAPESPARRRAKRRRPTAGICP